MRKLFGIALMLMVSMVVNAQVEVTIDEFTGGTIVEKSQVDRVVTITVTPAAGYAIGKSDIVVVPTVNPNSSFTRTDGPSLAEPLTLEGDDPKDLSEPRDYTFTVPEEFGAWVKEAVFHSQLNGTLKSGATWELTGETEKTLAIDGEGAADLGDTDAPWSAWKEAIKKVVIKKGVNELGDGLLNSLTALSNVEIQNGEQIVILGKDAIPAKKGLTVDVAGNFYNEYQTLDGWKDYTITSTTGVVMTGVAFGDNNSYDTFVSSVTVKIPSVLNGFVISTIKEDDVAVEEIKDGIIPAGVPVLLLSKDYKGHDFRTASTNKEGSTYKNLLKSAGVGGQSVKLGEVYLLYNDVFYLSQAGTVPEGGVYLPVPVEKESKEESKSFARAFLNICSFDDDNTTGIREKVIVKSEEFATAAWYGLDGRRLNGKPTAKGVYIHEGKKFIVK